MKMNREQLKDLIKECLVEVLNDGLGGALSAPVQRQSFGGVAEARNRQQRRPYDSQLDAPVQRRPQPSASLKEAIRREAGGNDIMASIFADTAATTLPAMISGDNPGASSMTEHINGTPEQVFGEEIAGKWEALAFSQPKKTA